ncbi:transglutaminase superfamily protein [Ulvibacter sp. MAR_2010_11]|uniref:transglutaminase domain-containing protein n=1 Tax=Ulvibacter sp. MAR_2010_11 TaxID=1250229 RepID=UPI000C2C14E9|nr:transglutaminase domain-containing protein [Ulvibacter sp. MAR_2010_11]PKA83937.1 transglutaminase superfamily protein [Ulvibacter sp. MAR_2010_11]
MNRFLYCLFAGLIVVSSFAQRKSDPTPEAIEQAKQLKSAFEDEDVIALSKKIVVSFNRNKRAGFVEAIKQQSITLLNISSNSRLQYPVFYDSESEVERFQLKDYRGKDLGGASSRIYDEHLKSEDMFHTDYRVKFANITFPLQGYAIEIDTEKKYNDVKYFTSEYFSDQYRILDGELSITIPDWLDMEIKEFNFEGFDIQKTAETVREGQKITYTFKGIDPQSDEANTPGPSYVYPHVLFIAKSYNDGTATKTLFGRVDDLYGWYNGLANSVDIDATVFASKVDELTAGAISEEEKIKNIFYWVQDNIRYIAFEDGIAGFKPDSPQNVFTKRYGDCKGMAILTKSMLEVAGFDSQLVWIGTDRLAYDYSIPSLSVDNHMICAVDLNGKSIFLDGTEKYNRFGEYATRIQNKQALLQDKDGFKILTVPVAESDVNIDKTSYRLTIEDETLVGDASRHYGGESRVAFQNVYSSLGKDNQTDVLSGYLKSGNSNYNVKEIKPFDQENRDEDLTISYDVSIAKAITSFDGTMYIDIDPVKDASGWIFTKRTSDYKFQIKERIITEIQLQIPEGYTVEMPENISVNNELVGIDVSYTKTGNKIIFKKDINLKKRLIKKEKFDTWNSAFELLKDNLKQQITLTKE